MATYNKRGYKTPKPEVEKIDEPTFEGTLEDIKVNESESTTAGVFNNLDEGANKIEEWVLRNRKALLIVIGLFTVGTIGYLLYGKYVATPNEQKAFEDMYQAQTYFQQATEATTKQDSLYKLALKGGEGKKGFVGIIEDYSGTNAGNLAQYYAGISYLNTKEYNKAIEHLDNFSSKDLVLSALAIGAKGDASSELNKNEDAIKLYLEAANIDENDFITPRFLYKAANLLIVAKKNDEALGHLKTIKEKYETSQEGFTVDALIATLEK